MIRQYLSNTNEKTTVSILQNILELNKALDVVGRDADGRSRTDGVTSRIDRNRAWPLGADVSTSTGRIGLARRPIPCSWSGRESAASTQLGSGSARAARKCFSGSTAVLPSLRREWSVQEWRAEWSGMEAMKVGPCLVPKNFAKFFKFFVTSNL